MNPYGDVVREHSRHPRNYGALDAPDVRHEDVNPFCGDRVRIELAIVNDTVSAARFQGDLCVIAKAASSLLIGTLASRPAGSAASRRPAPRRRVTSRRNDGATKA